MKDKLLPALIAGGKAAAKAFVLAFAAAMGLSAFAPQVLDSLLKVLGN